LASLNEVEEFGSSKTLSGQKHPPCQQKRVSQKKKQLEVLGGKNHAKNENRKIFANVQKTADQKQIGGRNVNIERVVTEEGGKFTWGGERSWTKG